jgi:hypothetical protein
MYSSSFSQTILNGSFELNSLTDCNSGVFYETNFLDQISFASIIPSEDFEVLIIHDTCHYMNNQLFHPTGVPDGSFALALHAASFESGNLIFESAISLEFSEPLIVGETYELGFYKRKQDVVIGEPQHYYNSPARFKIGISNNPMDFGTEIYYGEKATSIEWEQDVFEFTPTFSAEHLTIKVVPEEGHHNVFLDNFSFDPKVTVNELNEDVFELYPNPVLNTLYIKGDYTGVVKLHSMLGSTLVQQNKTDQQMQMDVSHLPSGIYFLQLGNSVHKIIKE